jgi:elongation factor Tu GTP binding domain
MAKENFFTNLFSFFKKKFSGTEVDTSTSVHNNDELLKKIENLETNITTYQKEIAQLEQQLSQKEIEQISSAELDEKYLALKTDFDVKEKELKKLKKEVDDLQEEVDDLEEDKKEQKRRFDRELSQKLEEFNQLISEKEILTNKLRDLEADKKLKSESITFVNNILNAKDADSKDYKYIFDKTTEICNYVQNEVIDVFKNILNQPIPDVQTNLYKWRNTELKTWLKDKKVIAIVGEFSSGKTSLVNRILNPDNDPEIIDLPTSSKETTAIPTYIEYAPDFYSRFVAPNGELKTIDTVTFQLTKKEIIDQVNVLSLIDTFVLGYQNKNIQNISILDTPGFGSNNKKLIEKTVTAIKEASAVFWLIDANTGEMNQSSINIIKEHLKGTELYVILNKCDTKSEGDLDALEAKVQNTVQQHGIIVKQFLRFSIKNETYRTQLMDVINSLNVQTNSNYIYVIKSFLESHLKQKDGEYRNIQQQMTYLTYQKEVKQNEIQNNSRSAVDACRNLGVTFNAHQNSLLGIEYGDKYYKMKSEDKERYDINVAKITEIVNLFSSQNNELLNIENQIATYEKQAEELRADKKYLEQVKANLSRLIMEYANKK